MQPRVNVPEHGTAIVRFNRNEMERGGVIDPPDERAIRDEPGLFRASLSDALKYGGSITRSALGAMNFRRDRRHIVVDVKIHMLMPGFCPAIPGWHTDGVPRSIDGNPAGKGDPNILAQEGDRFSPHRYHLLVTHSTSLTEFIAEPLELDIPDRPTRDLYRLITKQVEFLNPAKFAVKPCEVVEFDWWDLHRGTQAQSFGWRYLIRAVESDYFTPNTDLRDVIRNHAQVYVPMEFGW